MIKLKQGTVQQCSTWADCKMNSSTDRLDGSLWSGISWLNIFRILAWFCLCSWLFLYSSRFVPFLCRSLFSNANSWGADVFYSMHPEVVGLNLGDRTAGYPMLLGCPSLGIWVYWVQARNLERCSPTMYCTWLHDLARWTGLGLLKTMIMSFFCAPNSHQGQRQLCNSRKVVEEHQPYHSKHANSSDSISSLVKSLTIYSHSPS